LKIDLCQAVKTINILTFLGFSDSAVAAAQEMDAAITLLEHLLTHR
tara:strand:- start:243 stop:380 length:138 start_codon:yes stop_codon:yes gene_type:complete